MKNFKISIICLFFATLINAQKNGVQLKINVLNNDVDKIFLRNKSDIVLTINLKNKNTFASSFDIIEGIYQIKYDAMYTDVYLKNGFNLKVAFDGLHFYETLKFEGIGAAENNYIALEFKKEDDFDEQVIYGLNNLDFETYLSTVEKNKLELLQEQSFSNYFTDYEKKCIASKILKIRDLYQDRKLTQKK